MVYRDLSQLIYSLLCSFSLVNYFGYLVFYREHPQDSSGICREVKNSHGGADDSSVKTKLVCLFITIHPFACVYFTMKDITSFWLANCNIKQKQIVFDSVLGFVSCILSFLFFSFHCYMVLFLFNQDGLLLLLCGGSFCLLAFSIQMQLQEFEFVACIIMILFYNS